MTKEKVNREEFIQKSTEAYNTMLKKLLKNFSNETFKIACSMSSLENDYFLVLSKKLELINSIVIKKVFVEKNESLKTILDSCDSNKRRIENSIYDDLPNVDGVFFGEENFIELFKLEHEIDNDSLSEAYSERELTPVHPLLLAILNKKDPSFSKKYPNATHWKNSKQKWNHLFFCTYTPNTSYVSLKKGKKWSQKFYFAGIRNKNV